MADIWACFDAQGPGFFHDIDSITMFADYRVPQALIHLGVISYSETLMKRLQMPFPECVIQSGDLMEVEIRANSIWAVELVRRRIEKILAGKSGKDSEKADINAILIDFYTWDLAKANSEAIKHIPVHKTRTIFY